MALAGKPDDVDNKRDTHPNKMPQGQTKEKGFGFVVEGNATNSEDDKLGQPSHKDGQCVATTRWMGSDGGKTDRVKRKAWEDIAEDESDANRGKAN